MKISIAIPAHNEKFSTKSAVFDGSNMCACCSRERRCCSLHSPQVVFESMLAEEK